jgi:hypothetical protein
MNRFIGSSPIVTTLSYHNFKIAVTVTQTVITLSRYEYNKVFNSWTALNDVLRLNDKVKIKVILRPTVIRPVYLGIKYPSGSYDPIFITVWWLQACWRGALSLTRGRVCHLPESQSAVVSLLSVVQFTFYMVLNVCMYVCINVCICNIYKASVSPGSLQHIMPSY